MEETCKDWSKWAEDIYWTHFQTIHFSQYLLGDYDRQLAIPKKFVDNVKKKLPQGVTLKGPSGLTWDVELKTIDDILFFNHGWQEFVKDHSLEETDLLVFRYNGWSQFDVLIFDGKNLCEKGASYFVRKCGPTEHDNGCLTKKKTREGSIDDVHTPLDDGIACPSPLNYVSDDSVTVPSEQCIISLVSNKRTRQSARSVGSKEPATCGEGVKSAASDDAECSPISKNLPQGPQYLSNRRLVSEDEIKNALLLAQAASSDDTYLVVMRPTHVYKRFFVYIPLEWATNHLSLENQEIHLRFKKDTWRARYNHNRVRGYGGITGGWKHFVIDNNLEEFDVCLFKPAGQMDGSTILDVSIFRVVEEISPRTLLTPPRKRGRKNSIKIH
ncbi:hypothetical protein SO802_004363 [Lithocarpus litseifolius]|uniref:TF-B3 domain-containing protein n=1 Tax=Lithocarpus litseifolius TaxID=425828 RepID=A0AAW2E4P2_9ROSI